MDIKNRFDVPLPINEAWNVLLDVRRIAPCMPGAELLEVVDSSTFKGKVTVRLGPVALSFVGTVRIEQKDDATYCARLTGKGTDVKGRGGASGVVVFSLSPVDKGTRVDVDTQVNLSGAVAQYGRGAGIIQAVATEIVGQFATSLRAMLERDGALHTAATGALSDGLAASEPPILTVPVAKPISAFSLIVRVMWSYVRRLFYPSV